MEILRDTLFLRIKKCTNRGRCTKNASPDLLQHKTEDNAKWQQVSHANNQPWRELAFLQSPSRFIIGSRRYSLPMYCHFGLWDRCTTWNIRFCVARILYTDFCDLSMQMRKISFFTFFMNFHFFQWKFTLCVKIHFWGENSVERCENLILWKCTISGWDICLIDTRNDENEKCRKKFEFSIDKMRLLIYNRRS